MPPVPALLSIEAALRVVEESDHAHLRTMRVLVEPLTFGPGVPEDPEALSPLLVVLLRSLWRGLQRESPGDVTALFVVDRRDGALYRQQESAVTRR